MVVMITALGMFAVLIGLMPADLYASQPDYVSPTQQNQEVVDYFNAHNITLYANTWSANTTFSYGDTMQVLEDVPTTDHQIEFHTQQDVWGTNTAHVRHAYPSFFFGLWLEYHYMTLIDIDFARSEGGVPYLLTKDMVLNLEINDNASSFTMKCDHLTMNFVLLNTGKYSTLEECWDNNEIAILSSYEIDFDAMKPSAWLLVAQLVTFQNPDFGIPGDFGTVFNYAFAIGFWIVIAILIYTLVTRVIPTIQGGIED